ncbi:MAG: hypothetical protein AAGI66_01350 [Cyanobacteria bacterium P01_H01_bin.74]
MYPAALNTGAQFGVVDNGGATNTQIALGDAARHNTEKEASWEGTLLGMGIGGALGIGAQVFASGRPGLAGLAAGIALGGLFGGKLFSKLAGSLQVQRDVKHDGVFDGIDSVKRPDSTVVTPSVVNNIGMHSGYPPPLEGG